jgi:hypothetical protein
MRHPTDRPGILARAADIIENNGHFPGDFVPDPFDRVSHTPHRDRPMSMEAALRCASSGNPHGETPEAHDAILWAAERLHYADEPMRDGTVEDACRQLAAWGEWRTQHYVVLMLRCLADVARLADAGSAVAA